MIACLAIVLLLPELVLTLSDRGVLGDPGLRNKAYYYGAYWPGLLRNWDPNFAGQAWVMHITYGGLHSGLSHMIFNVITLVSLGTYILGEIGRTGFVALYAVSQIGGAVTYGVFSPDVTPMVGASGALFGLAGAFVAGSYLYDRRWRVLLIPSTTLIAVNVFMYWSMDGLLAWQTHLGGFFFGVGAYLVLRPAPDVPDTSRNGGNHDA